MKTKQRLLPTTVVSTNGYFSRVSSQCRVSGNVDDDFGIKAIPTGGPARPVRLPDGRIGYGGNWRDVITQNGTNPPGLQGVESITYATSPKDENGNYTRFIRCAHDKLVFKPQESYYTAGYYQWRWRAGEVATNHDLHKWLWYPGLYGNTAKVLYDGRVTDARFLEAANSALLNLLAGLPRRGMNLALAVCELKDVGQTIRQLASFTKWCKTATGGVLPRGGGKALTNVLRTIAEQGARCNMRFLAEAYLWYSFGVKPTIDDVNRFMSEVRAERLSVKGIRQRPHLEDGVTYSVPFYVGPEDWKDYKKPNLNWSRWTETAPGRWQTGGPNTSLDEQVNWIIRKRSIEGMVFARLSPQNARFRQYFPTSFSWSNPLFRTAWELVPFSFLVDWFVDVGKAVQRLDDLSAIAYCRLAWSEPWIWFAHDLKEWYPCVHYLGTATLLEHTKAPRPGYTGTMSYRAASAITCGGYWYLGKRSRNFLRGPAYEYGVSYWALLKGLVPERKVRFKRYQLSTGMALALTCSKGLK